MYCVYCGTKLPDEARFCFMCGKRVEPDRSAEDNAAIAGERNDKEATDVNETARIENPNAFADANDAGEKTADALEAADEEPHGESASNEKSHTEPEASSKNDADSAKVAEEDPNSSLDDLPAPSASSDKTTVIPLAATSDKTTILPGFGAEKAALEQEKSDEIAALAALYPDASPAQFCDPTPFEAKSPDITEFIAPTPINGAKPASAESVHSAESPNQKSAGKRALLIAIVVIIAALAAAAAFGMSLDVFPNGR